MSEKMLEEVDIAQATELTVIDQHTGETVADGDTIIGADEVENGALTIFVDSEME
jgi:hypothetical protein